jgi:hypothetical protein
VSRRIKLSRGDVLSYSSGTRSHDPYGFRVVRSGGSLLALLSQRWPAVVRGFDERLPLLINAYPANLGASADAVVVDTYLSHATGSRALELADREQMPVLLLGQPLYLADLLLAHTQGGRALPARLVLGLGGYTTPRSLEAFLRGLCAERGVELSIFHGYGVAEVDAACLIAVRRNAQGELVYERRGPDIDVTLRGAELLLARKDTTGRRLAEPFATGDQGRPEGDGFVIWNHARLAPSVAQLLESWAEQDWRRRTGYLHHGDGLEIQLREHVAVDPRVPCERTFHDYAQSRGHSWLLKPRWSIATSA